MKKTKPTDKIQLVQQSVIDTINSLRQHLSGQENSKEYVHRIRVDIKHLRAWLRLLRIKTEHQHWKNIDRQLLEHAKQLGSIRDTQAINKTINILSDIAKTKEERAAIIYIQKQLHHKPPNTTIDMETLKNGLLEVLDTFEQEFICIEHTSGFSKGLKHSYIKLKQYEKKTFSKHGSYDDFHKLRKWVKNLYYQLVYMSKAYAVDAELKNDLNELGNLLGKAHDLVIIRDRVKLLPENKLTETVYSLIDKKIALILKKAKYDYKTLFHLSGEKFIEQNNL